MALLASIGTTLADPPFARTVHDVRQRLGGERVDLWLAPRDPADLIAEADADAAEPPSAALIVVGRRHHRVLMPVLGGTSGALVRSAAVSVAVVPPV